MTGKGDKQRKPQITAELARLKHSYTFETNPAKKQYFLQQINKKENELNSKR